MELLLKIVENFRKFGKIISKELSTNIILSKSKNVQFLSELFYTQLFSKSNLVHCLLTVDFKTLFSSPRITS